MEVAKGLLKAGIPHVIVVDDGSREDCQVHFSNIGKLDRCTVLHHEVNRGKGRAIKTAIEYYLEHFDQSVYLGIVTLDADGQHLGEDVYKNAQALMEHPDSLILGTRNFDDEIVPFKSRRGNKLTSAIFKLLYGKQVNDVMTGLRAIPNKIAKWGLAIKSDRFEWETKMLIMAVNQRKNVIEVPIATVYFDHNKETHFDPVKDSIRIYKVLFASFIKFVVSAVSCVIIDQGFFAVFQKLVFTALPIDRAILVSTILARAISSFVNFSLNRAVVFEKSTSVKQSVKRYYLLCICQMMASALGVMGCHKVTGADPSVLKLVIDTALFWVFKRD